MARRIRVRFKIKKHRGIAQDEVSGFYFIGFVRGLQRASKIEIIPTIEALSTEDYYVVDVNMSDKFYEMAKGQAESYGISVEQVDKFGDELKQEP